MAQVRIDVAMIKQIEHLFYVQKLTKRAIARSLGVAPKTVRKFIKIAEQRNKDSKEDEKSPCPDKVLRLPGHWSQAMDWEKIHSEFLQGTSLTILHKELALTAVSYWTFNREYNSQKPKTTNVTMRLIHNPGEKSFFDFADGIEIVNRETGELIKTQLLAAVLPFSSYTWAEFLPNQKQPNLIQGMERAFHFFGGITPYVVIDNLKPGVQKAHIYDPVVNPGFVEFANHSGFAVVPARPRKPRDKAAVEGNIGIIQRGFYQEVRNQLFYSLAELNAALREYLGRLNTNVMKEYGISRCDRFEKEKSLLKPLPSQSFEVSEWRQAKVHPDCHIQVDKCCYSVPYAYVSQIVRVKLSPRLVEVFDSQNQNLIATHSRLQGQFKTSTNDSHYPQEKVAVTRFEIKFAKNEADKIGPNTRAIVDHLLDCEYPLKYLRRVQGILRLTQKGAVSHEAMEYAANLALKFQKTTFHYIKDAALHFEHRSQRSPHLAPQRDQTELYLHKQI